MNAVTLDTLKLARSLREKANLSSEQAEGFADAIAEALRGEVAARTDLEAVGDRLGTIQGDVRILRSDAESTKGDVRIIQSDVEVIKGDVRGLRSDLEGRIREAELRLERQIEASKAEILKWMFGSIGLQTVVILGAVLTFIRLIRP